MRRIQSLLIPLVVLIAFGLLTGCGSNIPDNGSGASASVTAASQPSPSATAGSRPSPTATPKHTGPVTLHTTAAFYQAGDIITVNVNNQSSQMIYFPDHLTDCSVVLLLREKAQPQASDTGRDGVNPCQLATATRMHSLGPGESLAVRLAAPKNGWLVGVYHASLSYHLFPEAGSPVTISSNTFTIGPLVPQQ